MLSRSYMYGLWAMFMHSLRPSWATLYGATPHPPKKKSSPFWSWSQKYSTCSCLISHRIPYLPPLFVGGGRECTRPIRDNGRSVGQKTFFSSGFARTCCSLSAMYTAKSIGQCWPAGQGGRPGATRAGKPDINKSESFS